jgi:hypothetical protein
MTSLALDRVYAQPQASRRAMKALERMSCSCARGFPNNGYEGAIDIAPHFNGFYAQNAVTVVDPYTRLAEHLTWAHDHGA